MRSRTVVLSLIAVLTAGTALAGQPEDPFLWLEEIHGARAMKWVEHENAGTKSVLEKVPEFAPIHEKLLKIYNSQEKIPYPAIRGAYIYNFWQDAAHVRGLWRRTTVAEYAKESPSWETVLDIDTLARKEAKSWVWKGAECLEPEERLCMIALSPGGGDAAVYREFDTSTKAFIAGGFSLPEAKSSVSWKDENTLWVGTDFGPGSLTTSGYPRIAKEWRRGTKLAAAPTVLEGSADDVSDGVYSIHTPEGRYDIAREGHEFFSGTSSLLLGGRLVKIDIPPDARLRGFFKDQMLVSLRSDWTPGEVTYSGGSLLAIDLDDFLHGGRRFDVLFEPSPRTSLGTIATTRNLLLMTTLDNVHSRLHRFTLADGSWSSTEVDLPGIGTGRITAVSEHDDTYFFSYTDFLTPSSLFMAPDGGAPQKVKASPSFFSVDGMRVRQLDAVSKDGTHIPYFVVTPKGFEANGATPTVLYGYGGFEVSLLPRYTATVGSSWLERGGVYVLANIRGGGEFGPAWHRAALKGNRHKAFEDFIAVAEDLVARKITSPAHLGIMGGSNGGLLVGAALTQHPELFTAVACQVPLLDMRRYTKLGAGSSWMAEYGDPDDPSDWSYIKTWSPYQNVKKGMKYPRVFFYTSTADDRVHPAHARKMAARMEAQGHPFYFYENTEGGHSAGADLKQAAHMWALTYAYLWKMLR